MPFTKTSSGDYTSPSGRHFTAKQVRLYYATNGFNKPPRKRKWSTNTSNTSKGASPAN